MFEREREEAGDFMLSGLLFVPGLFDGVASGVDVLDGGEVEFF